MIAALQGSGAERGGTVSPPRLLHHPAAPFRGGRWSGHGARRRGEVAQRIGRLREREALEALPVPDGPLN
jgi:hypothetical protein